MVVNVVLVNDTCKALRISHVCEGVTFFGADGINHKLCILINQIPYFNCGLHKLNRISLKCRMSVEENVRHPSVTASSQKRLLINARQHGSSPCGLVSKQQQGYKQNQ